MTEYEMDLAAEMYAEHPKPWGFGEWLNCLRDLFGYHVLASEAQRLYEHARKVNS